MRCSEKNTAVRYQHTGYQTSHASIPKWSVGRQRLRQGRRTPSEMVDLARVRTASKRALLQGLGCRDGIVTEVGSLFTLFTLRILCKHFATVCTVAKSPEPVRALYKR